VEEPKARRPYMPGYGTTSSDDGLLPWSWADERLRTSRNYWLATTWPDGRPHVMPVWCLWDDGALWFSSAVGSRKVRNLRADPRCVVTSEDAVRPVVVEGRATFVIDEDRFRRVIELENAKYGTTLEVGFLDPTVNATVRIDPVVVIGLDDDAFTDSPTRWDFGAPVG
jgi:PPOX class probable F420-dependent enzyme